MSAAHTLWQLKDEGQPEYLDGIRSQYTIATVDGRIIAYAFQEEPARLIAAAPALLEALDFMVNVSRSTPGFSAMAREQAERAIALAKGESA